MPISIFQSTKANHNNVGDTAQTLPAVANLNISKYESKSQLDIPSPIKKGCCCQSQYFKVRKQITTIIDHYMPVIGLLPISIFQSTKANHNLSAGGKGPNLAVANLNISKYESKSQQWPNNGYQKKELLPISIFQSTKANHNIIPKRSTINYAVANLNISKYESKSQLYCRCQKLRNCCCQSQYFKVRKQITTPMRRSWIHQMLLPISIFQSTKANHNRILANGRAPGAVANLNISKYESKSQRL